MSPNGMLNNCSSRSAAADAIGMTKDTMIYYLMHCTYDMHNGEGEFYIKICFMKDFTPSMKVWNLYYKYFLAKNEVKFKKVEDFLKVLRLIDITDILEGFKFGTKTGIDDWSIKANRSEEKFKNYWKPILNTDYGFCYTFESKELFPVIHFKGKQLLSMVLNFDVS